MRRLITLAVLLALLSLSGWATTYYVSTAGNNSWDGLAPAYVSGTNGPWLTLTYANSHVAAGDTIQIRGGTYQDEIVSWTTNGTSGSRITITNYPTETPIFDGEYTIPSNHLNFLFTVSGNYVTLSNITIINSNGALLMVDGNYSYAYNIIGDGSKESGIIAWGDHNILDGCTMTDNGNGYGLDGQGSWGSAIATGGSNTTIQNCIAYENRGEGLNAYHYASDAIMQDNIVYDNRSYNIYLDSTNGGICRRNIVYQTKVAYVQDGICVGGETSNPTDLDIYNNFVMGCRVNLVIDSNVPALVNVNIVYNTFVNSTGNVGSGYNMGVYFHDEISTYTNSTFTNNLVLEDDGDRVPIDVESSHSGLTFSYNCWSKTPIAAAQGTGDVVGDPKLAKTPPSGAGTLTANYFKILGTSPAIGKGIYTASVLTDYFGTTRKTGTSPNGPDIGGYEYVSGGGPPPVYYVDSSITDTYVGSATPDFVTYNHLTFEATGGADYVYKTIADINACTFVPDDIIYFRKGQTWREQLTVPSSGTSGHPITFGAYGTGDKPKIYGSTSVATWTEDSVTIVQAFTYGSASADTVTKSYVNTPAEGNLLIAYAKGNSAATNASISGWTKVVTTNCTSTVDAALFYKIAGAAETKNVVLVWTGGTSIALIIGEWTGISNPVVDKIANQNYGASATSQTSGTTATTTVAKELCIVGFAASGTTDATVSWTNSFVEQYKGTTTAVGSLVTAATGAYGTTFTWTTARISGGLIATFKGDPLWYATYAADPTEVWFVNASDGKTKWGNEKASKALCVSEYDWWWDDPNDRLYVYAATDPDSRYTSVEVTVIDPIVDITDSDYITISGLEVAFGGQNGIDHRGFTVQRVGLTVSNCTIHHCGPAPGDDGNAIIIQANNDIIEDNTIYECSRHGIYLYLNNPGITMTGCVIQRNTIYNCYHNCIDLMDSDTGTMTGNIVRYNFIYSDSDYADPTKVSSGIHLGDGPNMHTAKVCYNVIFNPMKAGIYLGTNNSGAEIYNNVVYGSNPLSAGTRTGIWVIDGNTGIIIKNNICMDNPDGCLKVATVGNIASCDYNCWYQSAGGTAKYVALGSGVLTYYHYDDFAAYKAATGWDTHGKWENPDFANAGGTTAVDYKLTSVSPCINAGVDMGLTEDYAGNPLVGVPDIGAYEWQGVDRFPPRLPLRLPCRVPLRKGG